MINLITRDNIDGLILAAYWHKEAKARKEGIHVSYVKENADSALLDLMSIIGLAKAMKVKLPINRRIVLHDVSLSADLQKTLAHFIANQTKIDVVVVEKPLTVSRRQRWIVRMLAFFMKAFMDRDDFVCFLSDYIWKRIEMEGSHARIDP